MNRDIVSELVKYVIFGVLTTLVNFLVYFPLNALLGQEMYLLTNAVAWVAAVAFAYVTNKLWVFKSRSLTRRETLKEAASFFLARAFSLAVEELGLFLLINVLRASEWNAAVAGYSVNGADMAKLAMQIVVIALNYILSKLIIFARTKGPRGTNNHKEEEK